MSASPEARRTSTLRGPRQRGVTLVELIVALVIAGVVMTSVWNAWTMLSGRSADPLVARQQLAVAQSLLREIELQPLPGEGTAAATPGRTGYASITDYDGLTMTGITDAEGQAVAGLEAYGASVSVSALALADVPASDGWWIQVSVTGPGSPALVLGQYRARR
jgi:MSHA pilin protein MshD